MWWKAVFQPKVKLNIFFILLAGICDSEIIPKLCWFREREKKILWTSFYSSCPQLINASKTPLCSLPYLCTSPNLALLWLPLTSIVLHHKIILLQNYFSSYELTWRRKLVWAGKSGLVSVSHLDLMWGCEAGSRPFPLPWRLLSFVIKSQANAPTCWPDVSPHHSFHCFPQGYDWDKFLERCLQLRMPCDFPSMGIPQRGSDSWTNY